MKISSYLKSVKNASRKLANLSGKKINQVLLDLAGEIVKSQKEILTANEKDLAKMDAADPKFDRLKLTAERINGISIDIKNIANFPNPLGKILEERKMSSGIKLKKVSVPIGVIGVIYEARPNVTLDVFALSLKSGNACVLKGGSEAENSNRKIVEIIKEVLKKNEISREVIYLAPAERAAVFEILNSQGLIDIIIPRGGKKLINYVRKNAKVPTIETGAGVVHIYFDISGDIEKAKKIVYNAKTRRPSVCNALDTLIVHRCRLSDLTDLTYPLMEKKVQIFADQESYSALFAKYQFLEKARKEHFGEEFLALKMSVKTVENFDEALEHIQKYSSAHSEAIIAEDKDAQDKFLRLVDSAAVYVNTSTAFTDGAQFGLGAEIGISTQKLHARGPMGLSELTSYKWMVKSGGAVRK